MTNRLKQQISELLVQDIEAAQLAITSAPPTQQVELVNEGIRLIESKEIQGDDAVKLLSLVQAVFAGRYTLFGEVDLVKKLHWMLEYSESKPEQEARDKAIVIAGLLVSRMRDVRRNLPKSTITLLNSAIKHAKTDRQKITLSSIRQRIDNAVERFSNSVTSRGIKFKIPELDFRQAAKNVQEDAIRDWYQDPWGWPEVEWLGKTRPQKVLERLRSADSDWTIPVDVDKPAGGIRPGMVINPLDRLAYQSLADELSIEATGSLPDWVYGWRLARKSSDKGVYESNNAEWKTFRRRVTKHCDDFKFAARIDIESFFASVSTSSLLAQIGRRYRAAGVIDRLEQYFESWHQQANGRGIPQRALASSVLAHVFLQSVDGYLNKITAGGTSKQLVASRWMDDIWLHSDSEKLLKDCVSEIEGIVSHSGLSVNAQKTRISPGTKARKEVQLVETYGESELESDVSLIDLLNDVEDSLPSQVNFEISKMIKSRDFSPLKVISSNSFNHFSFLGDKLAPAFRISGEWKRLASAYLDFAREQITNENLSVVAWGEMFPNQNRQGLKKVYEVFAAQVADKSRRLLTPLAAQRLVSWTVGATNPLIDSNALKMLQDQNDSFRLRGVWFAALNKSSAKDRIRAMVKESGENLSAQFIQETQFRPPHLSKRFQLE